jgi:hypothetical protein
MDLVLTPSQPLELYGQTWIFTATFLPLVLSRAICTCARDATPIGSSSNSENNSGISFPVSCLNRAETSSYGVGKHYKG